VGTRPGRTSALVRRITGGLTRGSWNVTCFAATDTGPLRPRWQPRDRDVDVGYLGTQSYPPGVRPIERRAILLRLYERLAAALERPTTGRLKSVSSTATTSRSTPRGLITCKCSDRCWGLARPPRLGALQQGKWDSSTPGVGLRSRSRLAPQRCDGSVAPHRMAELGDDDPVDTHHGTLPSAANRAHLAWSAFYISRTTRTVVQLILRPVPGLVFAHRLHSIRLTKGATLLPGSGASLAADVGFGFSGRPAGGRRDLFRLIETALLYDWNAHFSTNSTTSSLWRRSHPVALRARRCGLRLRRGDDPALMRCSIIGWFMPPTSSRPAVALLLL